MTPLKHDVPRSLNLRRLDGVIYTLIISIKDKCVVIEASKVTWCLIVTDKKWYINTVVDYIYIRVISVA
ncbi:hypothetical protein D3C73_722050 [compost metagenome]